MFWRKRYKYVFKGQRFPPHHANSKPSTVFVVFFKTKIYIYQERTFFYISQKKTFLHDYVFPSFGNYGNLRKKVPSTFIYKPILMKIDMNANIVKTQILFYDVWSSKICIFVILAFISNIGKIRLETQKYTLEKVILKKKVTFSDLKWPLRSYSFDKNLHLYNVSIHLFFFSQNL